MLQAALVRAAGGTAAARKNRSRYRSRSKVRRNCCNRKPARSNRRNRTPLTAATAAPAHGQIGT